MTEVAFKYRLGTLHKAATSSAVVLPGEDAAEAVAEEIARSMSTGILVTIGEVTNHLAAWLDPAHWREDWIEDGGMPEDTEDADAYVAAVFAKAREEL